MAPILESLARRARDTPDDLAFVVEEDRLSFAELLRDGRALAERFAARGVGPGLRVAILLPTGLGFIRTVYAVQLTGAAPVALDPTLPPVALRARISATRPSLLVANDDLRVDGGEHPAAYATASVEGAMKETSRAALPAGPDPSETAYLQLTSGSSGTPRPAIVSHRALTAGLDAIAARFELGRRDVMASWVPLHYSPGLVRYVFGTVHFGCPSHLVRPSAAQLPRWLDTIRAARATVTSSPDFAYRLAARLAPAARVDLTSLRLATSGGEAIRASTILAFERCFGLSRIVQPAYGLAEATLIVSSASPGEHLTADADGRVSCGRPLDDVEIRIVPDPGQEHGPRLEGEIVVRSPALFDGYLDDPLSTAAALREGWLHTGDIGIIDEAGRLFVTGRARALIKRGGRSVAPRAIEEAVESITGVIGAAAVGVVTPDSSTEALVLVAEVGRRTDSWRQLAGLIERAVVQQLGSVPSRILIVPEGTVPRTSTGKVRYAELQRLATDPGFAGNAFFCS